MPDRFTLQGYADLLQAFLDRGYTVRGFTDSDPAAAHLVIRHDLDMSLQAAEPIAKIEASLGVAATYFVLLRTDMYNPFSPSARASVEQIQAHGHEIGLHFDAALYEGERDALDAAAARECSIFEDMMGAPVRMISFHRPAGALLRYEGRLGGRRHAYEPRFIEEMGYCSDSRGGWHHGHPLDHPVVVQGRALQLLTHPIWWPSEPMGGPVAILDAFVDVRRQVLRRELADNCEPYKAALNVQQGN